MEHSVHAATQALVETVAPTPIHLVKHVLGRQASRDAEDDDDLDAIRLDDSDDDTNCDFDSKDLLCEIRAFVNQVHSSPQARKYFQKLCVEENIAPLQLLKWVQTRWASLYDLITRLLDVRLVCTKLAFLPTAHRTCWILPAQNHMECSS